MFLSSCDFGSNSALVSELQQYAKGKAAQFTLALTECEYFLTEENPEHVNGVSHGIL